MISGRLASPKPPDGGEPEGPGEAEHEAESRGGIQSQGSLATLKGGETLTELAEYFGMHPTQITEWKQQLLARASDVCGGTTSKPDEPDLKRLHATIGQLTLENDVLEGALTKAGWLSAKR